jgi:hypothetical protein
MVWSQPDSARFSSDAWKPFNHRNPSVSELRSLIADVKQEGAVNVIVRVEMLEGLVDRIEHGSPEEAA